MDLKVASDTDEFRSIADIATGGGSASGLTGGRRMSRRLQANGTEEQLTDILDGVKSLRAGQDGLQSQVRSFFKTILIVYCLCSMIGTIPEWISVISHIRKIEYQVFAEVD